MPTRSHLYRAELSVLSEMGKVVGQLLDAQNPLDRVFEILSKHLAVKRGIIAVADDKAGNLELEACFGLRALEKKRIMQSLDKEALSSIFDSREPFILQNDRTKPLVLNSGVRPDAMERHDIALLGAPFIHSDVLCGVVCADALFSPEVALSEGIRFLTIVAEFISNFILLSRKVKEKERDLRNRNRALLREVSEGYNNFVMVCKSKPMVKIQELIETVAQSNSSVIVIGEPGTEKPLTARSIHQLSRRVDGPFDKLNCSVASQDLLDSELTSGFDKAMGGSIFLDEVASLPTALQARLLSLLKEKGCEGREGKRKQNETVRVITAVNQDLALNVGEGGFREDLYYRLNVFPIHIPPLRERKEDISVLVDIFLQKAAREYGREQTFSPRALKTLERHSWPGNTKELEHTAGLLAILAEDKMIDVDLPAFQLITRTFRPRREVL